MPPALEQRPGSRRRWRTRGERAALALARGLRRRRRPTTTLALLAAAVSRRGLAAIAVAALCAAVLIGTAAGSLLAGADSAALLAAAAASAAAGAVMPSIAVFRAVRAAGIGVSLAIDETAVGLADLLPATVVMVAIGWLPLAIDGPPGLGAGLIVAGLAGFAIALAVLTLLLAAATGDDAATTPVMPRPPRPSRAVHRRTVLGGAAVAAAATALAVVISEAGVVATILGAVNAIGGVAILLTVAVLPLSRGGGGGLAPALLLIAATTAVSLALAGFAGVRQDEVGPLIVPAIVAVAAGDALILVRRRRALLVHPLSLTRAPAGAALARPLIVGAWLLAAGVASPPCDRIAAWLAAASAVSGLVIVIRALAGQDANETMLRR